MRRAFHPKKEAEAKKGREWRECEPLPYQKCLECCVGNTTRRRWLTTGWSKTVMFRHIQLWKCSESWVVALLTCPSSPLLELCVAARPNEMTHKYLELHHSSSVTPQNCEKLPFNKSSAAYPVMCPSWREGKLFFRRRRWEEGECNSFDKRRLNIGKKETLSPLPL